MGRRFAHTAKDDTGIRPRRAQYTFEMHQIGPQGSQRRLPRLLILEDDLDFADLLKLDLEDAGYEVEVVTSGEAALRRLSSEAFDLLITDIHIWKEGRPSPDGGLLLTGRLRNFPALQADGRLVGLPIIAISGAVARPGQSQILNAAKSVGADAVLAKPFESAAMRALVSQLLDERSIGRR